MKPAQRSTFYGVQSLRMAQEIFNHLIISSTTDSNYSLAHSRSHSSTYLLSNSFPDKFSRPRLADSQTHSIAIPSDLIFGQQRLQSYTDEVMANNAGIPVLSSQSKTTDSSGLSSAGMTTVQPPQGTRTIPAPNIVDVDLYLQQNTPLEKAKSARVQSELGGSLVGGAPDNTLHGLTYEEQEQQEALREETFGTKRSAASTGVFMTECQSRALTPVWDIREDPSRYDRWIGTVKVAGQKIEVYDSQPTKKDVRALLAERALPVVQALGKPSKMGQVQAQAEGEKNDVNWVGKLLGMYFFTGLCLLAVLSSALFLLLMKLSPG